MAVVLALVLGALTWTLMEYGIHRWLGHGPLAKRNPFGSEHIAHHSKGNHFAPTWTKAAAAVVVGALLLGPAVLVAGWSYGPSFVVGFVVFYLYYEALHRLEHVHPGIGAYGRWARAHHFYHHFHDPSMNHGVTSPIWDIVFGTYVRPEVIRVPEKLKMDWLCDPATGDVRPELAGVYALRRRRAAS